MTREAGAARRRRRRRQARRRRDAQEDVRGRVRPRVRPRGRPRGSALDTRTRARELCGERVPTLAHAVRARRLAAQRARAEPETELETRVAPGATRVSFPRRETRAE